MEKIYDAIIIGSGPAGLSCGLYLARANKSFLIFEKNEPLSKIKKIKQIDNYLGFNNISGIKLANNMLEHSKKYFDIVKSTITSIYKVENYFIVSDNINAFYSKNIVLATGVEEKNIIVNAKDYVGKGLSYCISCDGFLYKGKKVALIGTNSQLNEMKKEIDSLTNQLVLIDIDKEKDLNIIGTNKVEGLKSNKNEYECEGIFVYPSYSPINIEIDVNKKGPFIITDEHLETNIKGLYAIGDCNDKDLKQVSTAVSDGAIAATNIIKSL